MSSFGEPDGKAQAYSRKEKSLGLLCVNFLNHYTQEQVDSISLDEAAFRLGVERRRIYDIVNVLESVGVLVRKAKNRYTWKGYEGIPRALEKLRESALSGEVLNGVKNLSDLSEIKMNNVRVCLVSDDEEEEHSSNENACPPENTKHQGKRPLNKSSPVSVLTEASKGSPAKSKADCRREKSLGLLTQKFVQLFLVTQAQVVSLEDAARLLLGECKESAKLKTKVRRLYDIANILSSLNLIEKTHNTENRKPAFKWLGVKDNAKYTAEMATRKRQFGTVLSTNTNMTSVPKAKRGRPSTKDAFESLQPLNGVKGSSVLKPLQPKAPNVAGAVYNPVPVYPREGSAIPMPGMAVSAPGVPTSLTLGTSGGWREWTTADSQRVSEQKSNDSAGAAAGSSPSLKPSNLSRPSFASRNRDCSAGFSYGPFCPFRLQQQCLAGIYPPQGFDRNANDRPDESQDPEGSSQESEVTNPFSMQYQNEAMDQMFAHCMNAWKSWYFQAAVSATANATSASSPVRSGHEPSDSVTEAT